MDIKEALTFDGLKYFYTTYIKPLKSGAFATVVNNATTTVANTVLDGRMGKTLTDKDANLQSQINTLNSTLTEHKNRFGTFTYWDNVVSPDSGSATLTMSKAMRNDHMYLILMRRLNGLEDAHPPYAYLLFMRSKNYALTTIGEESEVVSKKISGGKLTLTFKTTQWTRMTVYEVM